MRPQCDGQLNVNSMRNYAMQHGRRAYGINTTSQQQRSAYNNNCASGEKLRWICKNISHLNVAEIIRN